MAAFDVAVIPYRENAYTASCFPLKTFEYLAAGKPVVATGLPELRGLEPHVVVADGPEAFVDAVERALADGDDDRHRCSAGGCGGQHVGDEDLAAPRSRHGGARGLAMRILVATDQWFPDRMGGVARTATETATRWALAGHDVVVLAPRSTSPGPGANGADGPDVLRVLPRNWMPQTLTDPLATRRHAARLGARFDVLVAHTCTTAWGLLSARLDAPLVYVFHADVAEELRYLRVEAPGRRERLTALGLESPLRRLERMTLRDAATTVVLSEFSRGLMSALDPEVARRALLARGAVDTEIFTPEGREEARERLGIDPDTRLVFSVRRLVPRMGLERLVDATALLRDVEGLRVAIAGGGPLAASLAARRNRLELAGRLDLIGRVSDADLPLWHRAADLFVLPTLAHEGFGLVTAEALASGTPVVGTPVGATSELIEPLDPRLLAGGTDAEAIAQALRTGLDLATPELRARAREYALARYSWPVVLPDWEHVLDVAVASGGRPAAVAGHRLRPTVAADATHD